MTTDSGAYSSLFALVDSHLSKVSMQENENENLNNAISIPPLNGLRNGSVSDTSITLPPCRRLPSFGIGMGDSSIRNILAEQVNNMLKAKEKKQQEEEEKLKLEKEMKRLKIEEEKSLMIDLTQAIINPYRPDLLPRPKEEVLSTSSSCESLFKLQLTDCDENLEKINPSVPLLPCITDMSYILTEKIEEGKCSAFGRVLTSRQKPFVAPYIREVIKTDIVRFDFSTPSPCDIIRENLRKPKMSSRFVFNIEEFLNGFE